MALETFTASLITSGPIPSPANSAIVYFITCFFFSVFLNYAVTTFSIFWVATIAATVWSESSPLVLNSFPSLSM
jgi:hypothetical protein